MFLKTGPIVGWVRNWIEKNISVQPYEGRMVKQFLSTSWNKVSATKEILNCPKPYKPQKGILQNRGMSEQLWSASAHVAH